ncbi:MAG: hypothetical protein HFH73_00660 [Lachnospiraceae bacterium]|jgi:hypothetical protein|nr:hypothetical protein [Lachnospiraceae bacterium]
MRIRNLGKCVLQVAFVFGMIGMLSVPVFASGGSLQGSKAVNNGSGKFYSLTVYNNNSSPGTKVYAWAWMENSSGAISGLELAYGVNGSARVSSSVAIANGYHCHSGGLRSDNTLYDPDAFLKKAL